MKEYKHIEIEKKWQNYWDNNNTFKTNIDSDKPKFYALDMFPYPSGAGLHVGHPEGYTATDIIARMKRMQGYEVLHPIGWDAFGLPAEQYAIQTNNHPGGFTKDNIANFKRQIKSLGFSYDWDRELDTTDPNYYKWTQWIFKQLYLNDLAELKEVPVNYCPECGTVLANEEVIDGRCERKGHLIERKPMLQWVLKITKYADRLLEDLEDLDWPESLKEMQRNWIGKSEGVNIDFYTKEGIKLTVFTTMPYTLYGVSAIVLAPEGDLVRDLVKEENKEIVEAFIKEVKNKSDLERTELNKDKSGVFTGSYVIHPLTKEEIPVFLGDYVLASYGTGVVMCVPSHDERDFEFGKKYDLEFKNIQDGNIEEGAIIGNMPLINSNILNGLVPDDASKTLIQYLEENELGKKTIQYKLRDWLFSRQRYWGEPFPIIHLENGEIILDDDSSLPVELPMLDEIKPGKDGTSPLLKATDWINGTYNGINGKRETNTMPQWAGSCWYYIRFIDPFNEKKIIDFDLAKKWLPVDLYIGGAEHAVLHLLYARFWYKFLFDIGVVANSEPFHKLFNQGMILGEGNEKMSKSKGNVVNPDDIVISHGADALRAYEMFMGPLDASIAWNTDGLDGIKRFLDRIWRLYYNLEIVESIEELDYEYNHMIKKVSEDFEKLAFNTALSEMMIFVKSASKNNKMTKEMATSFLCLLSPIAPHISEELYNDVLGYEDSISHAKWPVFDKSKLVKNNVEIILQVNGKIKKKVLVSNDLSKEELLAIAKEELGNILEGSSIKKEIIVVNKLVNFVI